MNIKDVLEQTSNRFLEKGVETPLIDARLLLAFVLKKDVFYLKMNPNELVCEKDKKTLEPFVLRRLNSEPVSKIIGSRGFWKLEFNVTKDVLDPRADSETLIEVVLNLFKDKGACLNILDLGTGSGCLALSLLEEYPLSKAIGFDISKKALEIAQQNACLNGLEKRFKTVQGDWNKENWSDIFHKNSFDIVISNPPYIPEFQREELSKEVVLYDPEIALFAKKNGLEAYFNISLKLPFLLKEKGVFVCEFGLGQEKEVQEIICQKDVSFLGFSKDYGGVVRALSAVCLK